jgi:hypothetical protein
MMIRPRNMYIAGTTKSVNSVPIESPVKITSPIALRPAAPAPEAITSDSTPGTVAAVDIRIGRSRTPAQHWLTCPKDAARRAQAS